MFPVGKSPLDLEVLVERFSRLTICEGLVMIVLSGADLWTSNIMFMWTTFLRRRMTVLDVLKNWFIVFFGNLAGSLFFMAIVTGYGGVFEESDASKTPPSQSQHKRPWIHSGIRSFCAL
ncbi:Formate/nitrite transporter-domain-containing protein [Delphinella strobiligena]|nr:Formate/nitrite transporter-domain-containing protein [Delphinella strobiligena]